MVNRKSDTEKRILKVINFKKLSLAIISLAIVVTLIIGIVVLIDGIGKDTQPTINENGSEGLSATDDSTNKAADGTKDKDSGNANGNVTGNAADILNNEKMSEYFEKLYLLIKEGYSREDTKKKLPDEYNYIISKEDEAVEFLKMQVVDILGNKDDTELNDKSDNKLNDKFDVKPNEPNDKLDDKLNNKPGTESDDKIGNKPEAALDDKSDELAVARRKLTAEWLISDIFKLRSKEEYEHYREEHSTVVLKRECIGRTGPGDNFDEWCRIPENTIICITGMLNPEWWTAKQIPPLILPGADSEEVNSFDSYFKADDVEFWINSKDFHFSLVCDKPLSFRLDSTNIKDAEEYKWVIKTGKETGKLYDPDNNIEMFVSAGSDNGTVGYALNNELIRLKKDDNGNIIKHGEWLLIERNPHDTLDDSRIGWIKDKYVIEFAEGMQPMQGFILSNTIIYKEPDTNSEKLSDIYGEFKKLKYNQVAYIHILDIKDDWFMVSAGVNSFVGWIQKDNVFYHITDEIKEDYLNNPEPDLMLK